MKNRLDVNLFKEGTELWWRIEIKHEVERQMGSEGTDELGNMLPALHREIDKAIWLWENTVRV